MIRALPVVIELALLVFCLIDIVQTDTTRVRNLPKFGWIVLVVILPLIGSIAWLVAGRPRREDAGSAPWPNRTAGFPESERPARALGPDDDPEFLAGLKKLDDERSADLDRWEEDLRRREQGLKGTPKDEEPPTGPSTGSSTPPPS